MIIDLKKPYQWDDLNEAAKSTLHFEGGVRVFQSVSQAVFEILMSIQNLYSHKKQFYHSLGFGTHADEGILFLARQGTKGIDFAADQPPVLDDKKTLFWLCDIDDAVTGQIYHDPLVSALDAKVFRIWVSHRHHFYKTPERKISDNDIIVYSSLSADQPVVAHFGKRAMSLQMPLAPTLSWSGFAALKTFASLSQNQSAVESLESASPASGKALLSAGMARVYDRALLFWLDLDGGAIRDLLMQKYQWQPQDIESLGLQRWNEIKLLTQFEKRGHSPEVFRGLVVLSASKISTSTANQLTDVVSQLRAFSHF